MEIKKVKKEGAFRYLNPFRKNIALYALCQSETTPGKVYNVIQRKNIFGSKWSCDCPDYHFRQRECKHIKLIKAQLHVTKM